MENKELPKKGPAKVIRLASLRAPKGPVEIGLHSSKGDDGTIIALSTPKPPARSINIYLGLMPDSDKDNQ